MTTYTAAGYWKPCIEDHQECLTSIEQAQAFCEEFKEEGAYLVSIHDEYTGECVYRWER